MPQRPLIYTLDGPPTKAETVKAIEQLQAGKAPGPDGIPPEIFKVGGEAFTEQFVSLFQLTRKRTCNAWLTVSLLLPWPST